MIESTTMASVTELDGNESAPLTYKFVVVALVAIMFVVVTIVPEATVNIRGPDNTPPVRRR